MHDERRGEPLFSSLPGHGPEGASPTPSDADSDLPLGTRLRRARERQSLPIDTLARSLKIPVKSLHALEEGRYDALPADVYARGFVKLYAEALGMDPIVAQREFARERTRLQGYSPRETRVPHLLRPFRRKRVVVNPRATAIVGGVLLATAALVYLFVEVRRYTRAPLLEVVEPPRDVEIHGTTLRVRGKTDPAAEVRINGERTFVASDGTFEELLGVSPGVNTLRITATSVGGNERTVHREVLARVEGPSTLPSQGPLAASPVPRPKPGDPFRLAVQAEEEPVWVSLRVDGAEAFSGLLLPNSRQEVRGREIVVTSGKGRRTRLFIDGDDRGLLSESPGVVRDIPFTRQSPSGTVEQQERTP